MRPGPRASSAECCRRLYFDVLCSPTIKKETPWHFTPPPFKRACAGWPAWPSRADLWLPRTRSRSATSSLRCKTRKAARNTMRPSNSPTSSKPRVAANSRSRSSVVAPWARTRRWSPPCTVAQAGRLPGPEDPRDRNPYLHRLHAGHGRQPYATAISRAVRSSRKSTYPDISSKFIQSHYGKPTYRHCGRRYHWPGPH